MRKIIFTLMLSVLCAGHLAAAQKTISSLPFTISSSNASPNDTFVVTTNLSATGRAITVSANNVVLDLQNNTITFGTSASNSTTGILVTGNNVTVENGTLIHGVNYSTSLSRIRGIDMNNCQNSVVRNMNITVGGYIPSSVTDGVNGIFNIFVDGNNTFKNKIVSSVLTNEVVGYYYRQYWVAAAVRLDKGYNDALIVDLDQDYHLWVCSTQVTKTPHSGFFLYGNEGGNSGAFWASDNQITVDARNDGPYTGYRYGEAYGIASRGSEHLRIWNNRIDYGTNYFGGMGIFLERTVPVDLGGFSLIHNNTIISSIGPLDATGTGNAGHSTGIRIRIWTSNFKIYENDITVYSDRNSSTLYRCGLANGIFMGYDNGDIPTDSIYIYNNRITTIAADGAGADCISIMSNQVGNPAVFSNNVLSSNGSMYHFATDGGGAYGIVSKSDTMIQIDNLSSFSTFYLGVNGVNWSSGNNKIQDGIYLSGASDTDIRMSNNGNQDITIQRTLDIKVMGNNSLAVTGATVTVVNGYGETVLSGLTNSSGRIFGPVSYWFASRTTTDSTNYNNFSLTVQKGTDTYVSDIVVDKNLVIPTINLLNTAGEIDSIPPDPINDLGCSPGSGDGNINLSWTSTGDDGSTGTGVLYEIKYSSSPITALNFDALATSVANPPLPQIAGSSQSMTVSGLTPGNIYYIAMKIYDDGGNPSLISNTVSCEASTDITTGGGGTTDTYVSTLLSPTTGATIFVNQPTLSVQNITAPGTNSYYFEVATDASFTTMETSSPAVPESNSSTTEWQVNTDLLPDQTYYWRVRVNSNPYSTVSNFSVASPSLSASSEVIAYPNPVSFRNGEQIRFLNLPNSSVELTIQTISGETLLHKIGVLDTWQWNGVNATGYTVATGTYLWYLQVDGNIYTGKIVNK